MGNRIWSWLEYRLNRRKVERRAYATGYSLGMQTCRCEQDKDFAAAAADLRERYNQRYHAERRLALLNQLELGFVQGYNTQTLRRCERPSCGCLTAAPVYTEQV